MDTTLRIPPPHLHGSPASVTRQPGRHRAAILAGALLSLALGQAAAAPGDLDPSFDADGLVLTHFGRIDDDSVGGRNDFAKAVVVQPDGKLVVAGSSQAGGGSNLVFALARYNPNGTSDTSFGSGGRVLTDTPSEFESASSRASALVLQTDGKIVLTGTADFKFVLARHNPDGRLDTSFDNDGFVFTEVQPASFNSASALVLQPDGKLVVAGESGAFDGFGFSGDFALARYNTDGSLDASFGSRGLVLTDFEIDEFFNGDGASALVLQPDGKLVAAGRSNCGLALARYNADGSLDPTFGSGGRVSGCEEGAPGAQAVVLQPDGKVVTVGSSLLSVDGSADISVLQLFRHETDGSLDMSFGIGGSVISISGSDSVFPEALILQPDGKMVVAGSTGSECFSFVTPGFECSASDFVLVRHNPDGSLDTSFGSGGRVLTNFSGRFDFFANRAQALVQQPDGKLVAAGIRGRAVIPISPWRVTW